MPPFQITANARFFRTMQYQISAIRDGLRKKLWGQKDISAFCFSQGHSRSGGSEDDKFEEETSDVSTQLTDEYDNDDSEGDIDDKNEDDDEIDEDVDKLPPCYWLP